MRSEPIANRLVFLSFDLEHDESERVHFCDQLTNYARLFAVDDWSTTPGTAGSDREKAIRGKLGRCDLVIILVGKQTASAMNVKGEIALAMQTNVPFMGVLVGGADESTRLPAGLAPNRVAPMDWTRIADAVQQLMGEGKHHKFV